MSTDGCVAIVTGGGSPAGFRIALRLIVDGVRVALLDPEGAEDNAEALGGGTVGVRVDPTDQRGMDAAVRGVVDRFGRLDHLVNLLESEVGGPGRGFRRSKRVDVLAAGLRGLRVGSEAALPYLRLGRRPGIVNVAPAVAARGFISGRPYSAEHITVIGLTRSAAQEHESAGVRVNAVLPVGPHHPDLGRIGAPGDLAAAVAFLCGDGAASITGEMVPVDSGYATG